jgi:hypothetical protein
MIPFKMKILKYNESAPSYTVQYTPDNSKCSPITLEIHVDISNAEDTDEVLASLKHSAPQEYWKQEVKSLTTVNHRALKQLVNTEHTVEETVPTRGAGRSSPDHFAMPSPDDDYIVQSAQPLESTPNQRALAQQMATPEQVAGPSAIARIKLKIAIQEVLREMAEGTV